MTRFTLAGALVLAVVSSLVWTASHAQDTADCAISYTRTACPGKEAVSYAKCDGRASCIKLVPAASPQACQAAALKACANDRLDITQSKVINAAFKGEALKSASGQADFCADYDKRAAEFDKCDSK